MQDAVKALLGEGVRVVARFTLSADQKDEWQNAFDGRGAMLAHASTGHDFPVDDWFHGCARVRSKMHDLENVIHLTAAFETSEPGLEPVQFPFVASEPWLAMEVPAGFDLHKAGDHVLYTASYPGGAFDKTAPAFAGLLLDEWTEVVPGTAGNRRSRVPPRPAEQRAASGDAARDAGDRGGTLVLGGPEAGHSGDVRAREEACVPTPG